MASVVENLVMGTRKNGLKTHCLRGHAFTVENTFVFNGRRHCRTCKKMAKKTRRIRGGILIKIEDRKASLWRNYKIRLSEVEVMEKNQNYVCAICSQPPSRRSLDVDHCHSSGKIRGLLCESCNKGLGHFKDNPGLMLIAAAYLQKSNQS